MNNKFPRRASHRRNRSHAQKNSHAFTLVELLVCISIVGILSTVIFSVLSSMSNKGKIVTDVSNLRQLSVGFEQYLAEHNYVYPTLYTDNGYGGWSEPYWPDLIAPYVNEADENGKRILPTLADGVTPTARPSIFRSPSVAIHHSQGDYGASTFVVAGNAMQKVSRFSATNSKVILLANTASISDGKYAGVPMLNAALCVSGDFSASAFTPRPFYSGQFVALFVDNHVEVINYESFHADPAKYLGSGMLSPEGN